MSDWRRDDAYIGEVERALCAAQILIRFQQKLLDDMLSQVCKTCISFYDEHGMPGCGTEPDHYCAEWKPILKKKTEPTTIYDNPIIRNTTFRNLHDHIAKQTKFQTKIMQLWENAGADPRRHRDVLKALLESIEDAYAELNR